MTDTDWSARARREAAAIIAEADLHRRTDYAELVSLVAIGWLQGVNYGTHDTLALAEDAFARLAEDLKA